MSDYLTQPTLPGQFAALASRIAMLERAVLANVTYTLATRPAATTVPAGTIIYVSDGGAGAVFQGSTGAAWVNLG
jgi:hypothetical protein